MKWELTGKPHWPLTTYEKLWGFWQFAGIRLAIGMIALLTPFIITSLVTLPTNLMANPEFLLFFGLAPIFGILSIILSLLGMLDWWSIIHGKIPEPAPWARILAYAMNEPDPWKEHSELQARLDEVKKSSEIVKQT